MLLWGKQWSRNDLKARIGALSQLGGITRFEYADGKAKGVSALRVQTAAGLQFTVLPEKGLDIFESFYHGKSLCWHSPAGVVHPSYYDARDLQWLKTFAGGLLTTCGCSAAGPPSVDEGEQCGLHGSFSNTPAEQVSWKEEWQDDELVLSISGRVRESRVFGPNLVVHRTIQTTLAGRSLTVTDEVENDGAVAAPLMYIYHCNFGFPLLDNHSRIYSSSRAVTPRTEFAATHAQSWSSFEPPSAGIDERVYFHEMETDKAGQVHILLVSDDAARDFAIEITYPKATLPHFIEWKMTGAQHYVLGLEPANCRLGGRKSERESGTLRFLEPGGKERLQVTLRVLDGLSEVREAIESSISRAESGDVRTSNQTGLDKEC